MSAACGPRISSLRPVDIAQGGNRGRGRPDHACGRGLDYDGAQQTLAVDGELFKDNADRLAVLAEWVDRRLRQPVRQLELAQRQILTNWRQLVRANIIRGGETREITVEVPVRGFGLHRGSRRSAVL